MTFYSSKSQIRWACEALARGRIINHRSEFLEANGWRLAAIVHRLRKRYHWPILTEYRGPENVAHYRLAPGTDPARLKYPPTAKAIGEGWKGGAV